ncbi:hypothetical protein EZS27_033786 [termite gut metagenome]|uniref:Uracil-DNA glycosylase-like domain-containing protein n=1 Tax=termite gut metagenome TaxID=433724 RepID=A0A5J4Q3Z8_9ZZZZ
MNEQKLCELKSLYDNELKGNIKNNYVPFFVRMTNSYDGKNGVLFVGKAENMENKDNVTIDEAFCKAQKWIDAEKFIKKPTGKAARSAYNRVVYQITRFLKNKNINHFARTNLYKLANTKTHMFGSKYEEANFHIFEKEIELLQPKFVIMLTSGLEEPFMEKLGEKHKKHTLEEKFKYKNKGKEHIKKIKCVKFDGLESIFITALHPQGKPEEKLVESITDLITATIQP